MIETPQTFANATSRRKLVVAIVLSIPVVCWGFQIGREQIAIRRAAKLGIDPYYENCVVHAVRFAPSSPFGDDDWDAIRPFCKAHQLDLTFTQVTSRSLDRLDDFPRLTIVEVLVGQITPEQEERLRKERPRLTIAKVHLIDGMRVGDGFQ